MRQAGIPGDEKPPRETGTSTLSGYSFLIFSELRRLGKISASVANSKAPKLASWEILLRSSDVQKPKEVRIETRNENADNRDARAGPVPRDWFARGRSRAAEALERFAHDVDENDSICKVDRSELNENGVSFLRTELDLGNTFVGIAQSADKDQEKAERNRAHGRKAYDSVLRFLPDVSLTTAEQTEFQDKLAVLKAALMALGEVFA